MIKDLDNFSKNIKGKIKFDYSLKNHTWLNIGGNAKIIVAITPAFDPTPKKIATIIK